MEEIQKADFAKRLYAFFADLIVFALSLLAVVYLLTVIFNTDSYSERIAEIKARYEQEYGVEFNTTEDKFNSFTEEEKENYRNAVEAVNSDEEALLIAQQGFTATLIILGSGILLVSLITDFVIPLFIKDGRSLGKLIFGLGVSRTGRTKVSPPVLFVRNIIGKCIFELLLPMILLLTAFMKVTGIVGFIAVGVLLILELAALIRTGGSRLLHDILADTVVVDWQSQTIFPTAAERDRFDEERKRIIEAEEDY